MYSKSELASYFKGVKDTKDGGFDCLCTCHDDHHPSAHFTIGSKGDWIGNCKTCGANGLDIARVAGANISGLFHNSRPQTQRLSKTQFAYEKNCLDKYPYFAINSGLQTHIKYRMPNKPNGKKDMRQGYDKDGKWVTTLKDIDTSLSVFSNVPIEKLKQAAGQGEVICHCEGEKDCRTAGHYGLIAFTVGGSQDFNTKKEVFKYIRSARLIIFGDNDAPGKECASKINSYYRKIGGESHVIIFNDLPEGGDLSDYMQTHTREELQELIDDALSKKEVVTEEKPPDKPPDSKKPEMVQYIKSNMVADVKKMLSYKYLANGETKIIQSIRNMEIVLENDSRFSGKIAFDEFSQQTYLMGDVPWETVNNCRAWSSADDSACFSILQSEYGLTSRNDFFDAIKNVAMRHKFHPVRDMLDSFQYDGKEHIRGLLPDYLGAEDSEYNFQVMKLWMLGAVSRVYQPGCKFDYCPILKGKQGRGKSTFLNLLALNDNWFNDSLDSLDSDKAVQSLMGSWIIELAELKSLARTAGGVDSVKRFISAKTDKIRLPYQRRAEVFLRQSVFCGTTNKTDFLADETGNRRYLIVEIGKREPTKSLFEPGVMDDIRAAWAQAVYLYKTEKPRLVLPESCRQQAEELQEASLSDDGKRGIIEAYLADKQKTCVLEIWKNALQENGRPAKWQSGEINNIIANLPDWERMQSPTNFGEYGKQRGFRRKLQTPSEKQLQCSQDCSLQTEEFMTLEEFGDTEIPFD